MSFCWTTITVKNLDQSVEFYRDIVGLDLHRRVSPMAGVEIAFLGTEESPTEVELVHHEKIPNPKQSKFIALGFTVVSLEDTTAHLKKKGITEIDGPHSPAPGIRFMYIDDPDGVRVQFVEN